MKKALIFDLDGTLLNTSVEIHLLINQALTAFHLPTITQEQTIQFVGNGAKKLVERAVGENTQCVEEVYRFFTKIYAECTNEHTPFYEGEREFLAKCVANGVRLAIITNKPDAATQAVCKKLLCDYPFEFIIGQSERYPTKPDPTSLLDVIKKMGLSKEDCAYIGDGETDVLTAINAGVDGIAVLWGYRSKQVLKEAGAMIFAENYAQLSNLIFHT